MDKTGSVLLIIGVVVGGILLASGGLGYYFYEYHVFETLRICISEDSMNTTLVCSNQEDCLNYLEDAKKIQEVEKKLEDAPNFLKEKIDEAVQEVVYCKNYCFLRDVRGLNIDEMRTIKCNPNEKDFKIEIHGKEAIKILSYLEELENEKS